MCQERIERPTLPKQIRHPPFTMTTSAYIFNIVRRRQSPIIGPMAPHKRDDSTFPVGRRASRRRSSCWALAGRRMSYNSAVTVLSSQESPSSHSGAVLDTRLYGGVENQNHGSFYARFNTPTFQHGRCGPSPVSNERSSNLSASQGADAQSKWLSVQHPRILNV